MSWIAKSAVFSSFIILIYYLRRRCGGPVCRCSGRRLERKVAVVTGGTSGIGLAAAAELAKRGATVIFTARNFAEGQAIQGRLRKETGNPNIFCCHLDLTDFSTVHKFAYDVELISPTVDLLINNAGIFFHPPKETVNGFDITFQTNYLGHFLLTELLTCKLVAGSRIIFVSSSAHSLSKSLNLKTICFVDEKAFGTPQRFLAYANSKLCLLLYSKHLAQHLKGKEINVYNVDPGSVETPIYRHFPFLTNPILKAIQKPIRYVVIRRPIQGAQTILHCALSPFLKDQTGLYYSDLEPTKSSELSYDLDLAAQLYDQSLIWTGRHGTGSLLDPAKM